MLRIIILGAAAGGGVPQWNCGCPQCFAARQSGGSTTASQSGVAAATQFSAAISTDGQNWLLINASPDIRQQLSATPALHPRLGLLRHTPISGVVLLNGEIDAIAGLLTLREGAPFTIHAHQRVLDILAANAVFDVLAPSRVPRRPIAPDASFIPDGGALRITPFVTPGKPALYLEAFTPASEGDTLGLRIEDITTGRVCVIVPACAAITPELTAQLRDADVLLFDGTVWRDDELSAAGLGHKTGAQMGHMAMSGDDGVMARLRDVPIGRKVFVHINNSNPVLRCDSAERAEAAAQGWEIAYDGMEITL